MSLVMRPGNVQTHINDRRNACYFVLQCCLKMAPLHQKYSFSPFGSVDRPIMSIIKTLIRLITLGNSEQVEHLLIDLLNEGQVPVNKE